MIPKHQMASAILAAGALLGFSEGKLHIGVIFAFASLVVFLSGPLFKSTDKQDA